MDHRCGSACKIITCSKNNFLFKSSFKFWLNNFIKMSMSIFVLGHTFGQIQNSSLRMRHPNILNIIMVSDLGAIHTAILSILGTTSEKIKSKKRDFGPFPLDPYPPTINRDISFTKFIFNDYMLQILQILGPCTRVINLSLHFLILSDSSMS